MKITNKKLRKEFATPGRCENCVRPCRKREGAHIFSVGAGGPDFRCNLVSLGSSPEFACECHTRSHNNGEPGRDRLLEIAAMRERTTVGTIIKVIDLARRLNKYCSKDEILQEIELLNDPVAASLAIKEFTEAGKL